MAYSIDCLFIGQNEIPFNEYEKVIKSMGENSAAYRNYNLNYIQFGDIKYSAAEAFNLFYNYSEETDKSQNPLTFGESFSLTIAYLGSFLNKRGLTFDYINSFRDDQQELIAKLQEGNILTIAIPTTLYVTAFPIIQIISFIRKYNNTAKIIIGGPFISAQMRSQNDELTIQYLLKSLDADFYINSSQGEGALVNIIKALKSGTELNNIKNIIYKDRNIYINNEIEIEENSLEENVVNWELFSDKVGKFISVRTSLSCPFSCSFCSYPQHAGKYKPVNVDIVEQELNAIERVGKVKSITFIDDTFNVPPERFKEILRMIIKNKYNFKWNSYFRCQFADLETIELMKESGCEGVFLGIESGSQQILDNMNKRVNVEKYIKGIELLNKFDITNFASFIIGFPGETQETVNETINFIEENKPTYFRTQIWYCDPLTTIWKERDKYNIKGQEFSWSHSTMNSDIASNIVDEIFLKVKNSRWMPEYNFEYESIYKMLHKGISLKKANDFIDSFNDGIKERLIDPNQKEISREVFNRLKAAFYNNQNIFKENSVSNVEFDFDI